MATQVRINRPISDELSAWLISHPLILSIDRQPASTVITLRGTPTQQNLQDMIALVRDKQDRISFTNRPAAQPDMEVI